MRSVPSLDHFVLAGTQDDLFTRPVHTGVDEVVSVYIFDLLNDPFAAFPAVVSDYLYGVPFSHFVAHSYPLSFEVLVSLLGVVDQWVDSIDVLIRQD